MTDRLKKRITAGLVFICLLFCGLPAQASAGNDGDFLCENPDTGYCSYLEDGAGLLENDQTAIGEIEELMEAMTAYGDVAVITLDRNSTSTRNYAKSVREELFGSDSSSVFVIDRDNRELYIFSYGTMYKYITTAKANTITDNTYRYATDGGYDICVIQTLTQMLTVLEGGKINQTMKYVSNALLAVLFSLMIVFLWAKDNAVSKVAEVSELLESTVFHTRIGNASANRIKQTRSRHSDDDSGGSGGGGGGGSSGGGGGGGHSF